MKTLKQALTALGFQSITRSIWTCRSGDLVHAVFMTKDRYGADVINVLVCIPSFFEQDEPLARANLQSPLMGAVSPRGVVSSWAWDQGTLDVPLIVDVIRDFFRGFLTSSDVRRALDGMYLSPHFENLLPLDLAPPRSVTMLPHATYEVVGGACSGDDRASSGKPTNCGVAACFQPGVRPWRRCELQMPSPCNFVGTDPQPVYLKLAALFWRT